MTKLRLVTLLGIVAIVLIASLSLGYWSQNVNPEGIQTHAQLTGDENSQQPHPTSTSTKATAQDRDAFLFGVSFGLLGCSFIIGIIGFVLLIRARSKNEAVDHFVIALLAIAAISLVLSYLVDDYFL